MLAHLFTSLFLVLVCIGQLIPDQFCLCLFGPIENTRPGEHLAQSCCHFKETNNNSCSQENETSLTGWIAEIPAPHNCLFMKPKSNENWVTCLFSIENLSVSLVFISYCVAIEYVPVNIFPVCYLKPIVLKSVPIYLSFLTLLI